MAEKTLRFVKDREITAGRDLVGPASPIVYFASSMKGYRTTQNNVANSSGVTIVTVRNVCSYMAETLGFKNIRRINTLLVPTSLTSS